MSAGCVAAVVAEADSNIERVAGVHARFDHIRKANLQLGGDSAGRARLANRIRLSAYGVTIAVADFGFPYALPIAAVQFHAGAHARRCARRHDQVGQFNLILAEGEELGMIAANRVVLVRRVGKQGFKFQRADGGGRHIGGGPTFEVAVLRSDGEAFIDRPDRRVRPRDREALISRLFNDTGC